MPSFGFFVVSVRKNLANSFPFFLVRGVGFEPGSSARKAEILNLTILSEPKQGINQIKHTYVLTFLHQKDIFAEEGVPSITFEAAALTLSTYFSSV